MQIQIEGNIKIARETNEVFTFLADLKNDQLWRKEINRSTMQGPPALGVMVDEDSYLSKKTPHSILQLTCIAYELNQKIIYESIPSSPFYLKSTREIKAMGDIGCEVIYSIIFDKSIVKHGLGFDLPNFLIKMVANRDMKKYLGKLKEVLEKG